MMKSKRLLLNAKCKDSQGPLGRDCGVCEATPRRPISKKGKEACVPQKHTRLGKGSEHLTGAPHLCGPAP